MSHVQQERKPRKDKDLQSLAPTFQRPFSAPADKTKRHKDLAPLAATWHYLPETANVSVVAMASTLTV